MNDNQKKDQSKKEPTRRDPENPSPVREPGRNDHGESNNQYKKYTRC